MEVIYNQEQLDACLQASDIRDHFSEPAPEFTLLHYAPGEIMVSPLCPSVWMQFIISGKIYIFDMDSNAKIIPISWPFLPLTLIAETELLDPAFVPHFVEASTDVISVGVEIARYREQLMCDPVFLRYVALHLMHKLGGNHVKITTMPLYSRLVIYLRNTRLTEFGDLLNLSQLMHTSTRQLNRVIKQLTQEGCLERTAHGHYRVVRLPLLSVLHSEGTE